MDEAKRDYLARYKPYAMQIKRLQQRLNKVNEMLRNLDCHGLSEFRQQRMRYDYQLQHDELEQRISGIQTESEPIKQELLNCIASVPNTDWANTLRLRFIDCLPCNEIAIRLYVAIRTVSRWQHDAIEAITIPVASITD